MPSYPWNVLRIGRKVGGECDPPKKGMGMRRQKKEMAYIEVPEY